MSVGCARCGAEIGEGARFCSACGAPVEAPADAERKLAAIVFADLVGSTELIHGRDPEDVRRLLDPFFEIARATLEEHGGRVEKFIGDAVMAVFGVPRAHGDDPDRAVAAALALVGRLAARSELEVRVGVEAGEVLASVREPDRAITGEPAHAAARLQQAAAAGEVLVGARAAASCRAAVLDERRTVAAKGFPAPLDAWRAVDATRAAAADRTNGSGPGVVPLLGRGGELETLRLAYLQAVRERSPRLALIVGEAGAGKTRLAAELIETVRAAEPAPSILTGRNPPYGDGIAFWALAEILRSAAAASPDAGAAEVREALAIRLRDLDGAAPEETARALAATLAGDEGDADVVALRRSWRRLVTALAGERPVLIAVDDAHWADDGFLDLLENVAGLPSCPLLIVCTARPEIDAQRPGLGVGEGRQRVELGPLPAAAAEELAAALVAGSDLELAREIAETSGGNPFFAEEIAHAVAAGSEAGGRQMPDTVQAAIASRLDALPAAEKRVLQLAAVLGDRFRVEPLRALLSADPDPALAGLRGRGLIDDRQAQDDGLYGFHHQLIRDVAYATLTHADRIVLHERAARGLEERAGARYPELVELIAFHLARAAELDPGAGRELAAFESAREASTYASKRGAPGRAQELLEQAARHAPDPGLQIEVLFGAYEIAMSRLRGDHGVRLLIEASETAERIGDSDRAARGYVRAVEIATRMAGVSGAVEEPRMWELLDRAHRLAPAPDASLRAHLALDELWIPWAFRRDEEVRAKAGEALELARRSGDASLLSSALDAASAVTWSENLFAETVALCRERVEVLAHAPDSTLIAVERTDALNMLTEALVRHGEPREALRWDRLNAAEMAEKAPHIAAARGIHSLYVLGEWDTALEQGVRVREGWLAEGRPPFAPFSPGLACVGAIHGLRGDEAAARDWFEFADQLATNSEQVPGVRLFEADVALHRGEVERAVSLLGPARSFWWQQTLLARRAEALVLAGDPEAGAALAVAEAEGGPDARVTIAIRRRARGVLDGDEAALREALALFDRIEYPFESARTAWMLGGDDRARARAAFERLGAVLPA